MTEEENKAAKKATEEAAKEHEAANQVVRNEIAAQETIKKEAEAKEEEEKEKATKIAADSVLEKIKEQNKIMEENIARGEKLLLAGKTGAGAEITNEEKEIEGARALLAGSGFEDKLFPVKNK